MKKKFTFIGVLLFLICNDCTAQTSNDIYDVKVDSLKIENINRSYSFYIPKGIKEKAKLILVLHGATMTSKLMLEYTGYEFNRLAHASKDAIIVYPQAYDNRWNDCKIALPHKAKLLDLDEASFFTAIIERFTNNNNIDKTNVFVVGFSNGGHMVYKLAKQNPDIFKGFAAIAGNIPVASNNDCFTKKIPVSILIANGTSDPIIPYLGGEIMSPDGTKRGKMLPTLNTLKYWTDLINCDKITLIKKELLDLNKEDNSNATIYEYECKKQNKKVQLIEIANGGHNIPNPSFESWPNSLGNVNKDINLPELIINFFNSLN